MTTLFDTDPPQDRRHPSHQMHENSLEAWAALDGSERWRQIREILAAAQSPLTDREICTRLGSRDMNYARPTITRARDLGLLREVGSVKCTTSGRTVRLVGLVESVKE